MKKPAEKKSSSESGWTEDGGMICEVCGSECECQFGGELDGVSVPDGCEICQPEWYRRISEDLLM